MGPNYWPRHASMKSEGGDRCQQTAESRYQKLYKPSLPPTFFLLFSLFPFFILTLSELG